MQDKTLQYLDYLKLLHILKRYASTASGQERISDLKPLNTAEEIRIRQEKIDSLLEVLKWEGKLPLSEIPDIRDLLKRLSLEHSVLETQDFISLATFLRACEGIIRFLRKAHVKKSFVEEMLSRIKGFSSMYQRIVKTVNPEGYIEDTASYELSRVRAELFQHRERVKKRLEKMMELDLVRPVLQDTYIAIRNGRYVIPMKPNFNEAFQGIVHDYSHTLKTSFVEPMDTVEWNNSINMLEKEEIEEEKRVLTELTEYVRKSWGELDDSVDAISELDLHHSLAVFAAEFECVRPEVSLEGAMEVKGAVNPFIRMSRREETVAIDISLSVDKRAMIISGPNAGGKTAALKTIGLIVLMAQSGLFVPAREVPLVPLFRHVFAVIGDEQDISMELSSFTAHMMAIKELYQASQGGELVLIDEIGGSTEPQEASALSMAIMDAFVEKDCRVVVTTHLNLLKAYGYTKPFAINVATAFNAETMRPLYKLSYGIAGYSNAISVAKNIDVPSAIVERSYDYLGKQEQMLNELVSALESGRKEVDREREELIRLKEEARKRLILLKEKRDEYFRKVEERTETRLLEVERELREIEREIARKELTSLKRAGRKLEVLRGRYVKTDGPPVEEVINVGDFVKVRSLGSRGYVAGIDKQGDSYEVVIGNLRTKIARWHVEKVATPKRSAENAVQVRVEPVEGPQLNVMGMRVEEALKEVDRFMDRAVVQGVATVKILHGIGTGRLMSAIKSHLAETRYVKDLKADERNLGVTIVELA
jgi:DNA mismatch repair protein MutS2